MRRATLALTVGLLFGLSSFAAVQDAKKDDTKPSSRLRGQLPPNYRQLGLSEEQRQSIYKIHNEYADKIDELEKQIEKMKNERNRAYGKVLTKAQRDRLEEIQKGKSDTNDK
jgi:Spy/CpxP family protein refolding chaperone